jgi:hypothetical protein
MTLWPDFSIEHKEELSRLGVTPAQIVQLRRALLTVRSVIAQQPRRGDVREILRNTASLSASLAKCLGGSPSNEKAHIAAAGLIASAYWKDTRVRHTGATVALYLIPLLESLGDAARSGISALPRGPVRHKTADPKAIEAISNALVYGWSQHNSVEWTNIGASKDPDPSFRPKPFPKKFRPNWSSSSTFARIVSTCFAAVGGNEQPERAIKAYMEKRNKHQAESRANFNEGIDALRTKPS